MHKKPILIILLICTVLTAGLVYINNVFLPVTLKDRLAQELSKALKRSVTIQSLFYIPLKGIILKNVAVQDNSSPGGKFFTAPEIRISVFYLPLFTQKKIIIPSLVLDHPRIILVRGPDGVWNIQDLVALPSTGANQPAASQAKDPLSAYLTGLTITNGTIVVFDQAISKDPIETITNISVHASLALPKNMKAEIKIFPETPGTLKLFADLNYDFVTQDFLCLLNIENFSFEKLFPYMNKPDVTFQQVKINTAALHLAKREKKLSGRGEILFDQIKMQAQNTITIQFSPALTFKEVAFENNILSAKGILDIKQGEISLEKDKKTRADISYDFIFSKTGKTIMTEGTISSPDLAGQFGPNVVFTAQPKGKSRFVYHDGLIESQSRITIQDAKINIKPEIQFLGSPVVDISFVTPTQKETKEPFNYLGAISFSSGQAINIPYAKTAENISGKISFNPNKMIINAFSGVVNQTPLTLSGSIENFKDPFLSLTLGATNADLAVWKGFLSDYLKDTSIDTKGTASLKLHFKGKPGKLTGAFVDCTLSLKDAAFKNNFIKDGIFNISGEGSYKADRFDASYFLPDEATWKNLHLTYKDRDYTLDGSLKYNNLSSTLKQDQLSLTTEAKIFPDRINILDLNGRYKNSNFSAKGEIVYPRNNEKTKINGKVVIPSLYLEDLGEIIPVLKEKLKDVSPKGLCTGNILFAGEPLAWKDWTLVIGLSGDEISLYNYKMNKAALRYEQRDRFINSCTLTGTFYDGTISLEGSSDLSIEEMPYKTTINIKNVDFEKLKNDSPLKDKELSGFISGAYQGVGPLANLKLSQGNGNLSIKDGKLWRFDVLDGLAQLLFVPEKQNIALDTAEADFSILNEKVVIKDGLVKGNQVELSCNGNITFLGDLDLDITAQFDEGVVNGSQSFQKSIAAALSQGEDFLTVKVTGTIKEPKYLPKSINVFEKTKDLILDALPNIF